MATRKPDSTSQTVQSTEEIPVVEPAPATTTASAAPTVQPVAPSVEDILRMVEQLNAHRQVAIDALLAKQTEIATQLKALGYQPQEPQAESYTPTVRRSGVGAAVRPDAYCKICQLNGHDARMHRGQAVKKRFTASELAALS